jgi:hypothetical protein
MKCRASGLVTPALSLSLWSCFFSSGLANCLRVPSVAAPQAACALAVGTRLIKHPGHNESALHPIPVRGDCRISKCLNGRFTCSGLASDHSDHPSHSSLVIPLVVPAVLSRGIAFSPSISSLSVSFELIRIRQRNNDAAPAIAPYVVLNGPCWRLQSHPVIHRCISCTASSSCPGTIAFVFTRIVLGSFVQQRCRPRTCTQPRSTGFVRSHEGRGTRVHAMDRCA